MMKASADYRVEAVSAEVFYPFFIAQRDALFADQRNVDVNVGLSDSDKEKIEALKENYTPSKGLYFFAYIGDDIVGWTFGEQTGIEEFYMVNSAVFPQHRRKGVYRKLMNAIVAAATDAGYQHVFSRHVISNNAVIIPKLQAGFMISAIEMNPRFGTLVRLSYFPNEERARLFRVGAGAIEG
jgi:ribosomal protein S18 acetylase RimI-like enzyme